MLKSLQHNEPREKAVAAKLTESKVDQLQRQLDELKKASLKPFRISKICSATNKGLLDSGATHPLRARVKRGEPSTSSQRHCDVSGGQGGRDGFDTNWCDCW